MLFSVFVQQRADLSPLSGVFLNSKEHFEFGDYNLSLQEDFMQSVHDCQFLDHKNKSSRRFRKTQFSQVCCPLYLTV